MSYDWRSHFNHRAKAFEADLKAQVGKTVYGQGIAEEELVQLANHIRGKLGTDYNSVLCDLGCGNGILTEHLAASHRLIYAYDFSSELIRNARFNQKCANIIYEELDLHKINRRHCKNNNFFLMNEVVQHLEKSELQAVLRKLYFYTEAKARLFIGGVPNEEKLMKFYDTEKKMEFYRASIDYGKPHLGTWWSPQSLCNLAKKTGWDFEFFGQPKDFYSSHYRFDCLISKKG